MHVSLRKSNWPPAGPSCSLVVTSGRCTYFPRQGNEVPRLGNVGASVPRLCSEICHHLELKMEAMDLHNPHSTEWRAGLARQRCQAWSRDFRGFQVFRGFLESRYRDSLLEDLSEDNRGTDFVRRPEAGSVTSSVPASCPSANQTPLRQLHI